MKNRCDYFKLRHRITNFSFDRGIPKSKLKASGYILLTHCVQKTDLEKFFRKIQLNVGYILNLDDHLYLDFL